MLLALLRSGQEPQVCGCATGVCEEPFHNNPGFVVYDAVKCRMFLMFLYYFPLFKCTFFGLAYIGIFDEL